MKTNKGLAQGCAVIFVYGAITFLIGIAIGKYWL